MKKNLVDTQYMQGLLDKEGYKVNSNISDSNVVVVNTCSFIETVREESIRKNSIIYKSRKGSNRCRLYGSAF